MSKYVSTFSVMGEDILIKDAEGRNLIESLSNEIDLLEFPTTTYINVKDYGVVGDGDTDDTETLQALIDDNENCVLFFPNGTYKYSGFDNFKKNNFTFLGAGSGTTVLYYTGSESAIKADAFIDNLASDPFINNFNIIGVSIYAPSALKILDMQGVARSKFNDIRLNGTTGIDGTIAISLKSCSLNNFTNVLTSYSDGNTPYRGLYMQSGSRASVNMGGCSNNNFINLYTEGNGLGIQLATSGADQNTFIGGASEKCSVRGGTIGQSCRYNTFIGTGFESSTGTSGDMDDYGSYTKYINCYSSNSVILKGIGQCIEGGFFERLEITSTAKGAKVENITVNHWTTTTGGFVNNGSNTRYQNIYDDDSSSYIFKNTPRTAVTLTGSPFKYVNPNIIPIKFIVIGGTVSQVQLERGGDTWYEQAPTTGSTSIYLLMPGDNITLTYSVAPTVNIVPLNGI